MPYLQVNQINLYYKIHGRGKPLLLIHGLGSSTQDWENQLDYFSQFYQVIVLDLRGHGKTDKPQMPYTISLFSQDIAEFIRRLHLEEVNVVGHSMGGMIAFQLALDFPQFVHTLTIVNSAPAIIFPSLKFHLNFYMRFAIIKLFGVPFLSASLAKKLFPKPEQEALRQKFIERWSKNDSKAYLNSLHAFSKWSVINRLSELHCSTLIITADHDYTSIAVKESYAKLIQHAEVAVIENSWHMTIIDQPVAFNKVLSDFLKRNAE